MTVKDLLKMNIDIDVCDDVCEELYIAYCGPMKLTEEGEARFAEVLDYEVEICGDIAIVKIDGDDAWEKRLSKAKKLFNSLAGFCREEDYKKWFGET